MNILKYSLTFYKTCTHILAQFLKNNETRSGVSVTTSHIQKLYLLYQGIRKNQLPIRAAALSYYSLMSLGPLLAIVLMISSFMLKNDSDLATRALAKTVSFIAPSTTQLSDSKLDQTINPIDAASPQSTSEEIAFNPHLVRMIDQLVKNVRYGTVGGFGMLILIFICIQLISSIESTLNTIWHISGSRSIAQRIMAYWTLITLGGGFGITAFTFLSANTLKSVLQRFPSNELAEGLSTIGTPFFSFGFVVCVLACLYRYIPHTTVRWKPAFGGAILASLLLWLNNYLSYLYVSNVVKAQNLYGSIGIIPVLMFGLFIFWNIFLLGSQISYILQNARLIHLSKLWRNESAYVRECTCLAIFLDIARDFQKGYATKSKEAIAEALQLPHEIVGECITLLTTYGWISSAHTVSTDDTKETYQPAHALESMTLAQFHTSFVHTKESILETYLEAHDPILKHYQSILHTFENQSIFNQPLTVLFQKSSDILVI